MCLSVSISACVSLRVGGRRRAVFNSIDLDSGGTIDKDELKTALSAAGREHTDAQIMSMMKLGDSGAEGGDGDGEIDFDEVSEPYALGWLAGWLALSPPPPLLATSASPAAPTSSIYHCAFFLEWPACVR